MPTNEQETPLDTHVYLGTIEMFAAMERPVYMLDGMPYHAYYLTKEPPWRTPPGCKPEWCDNIH